MESTDPRSHATLRRKFSRICESNLDPSSLARDLFAMGLIDDDTRQEAYNVTLNRKQKLERILGGVMANGAPGVFQEFVTIVRRDPAHGWLANELEGHETSQSIEQRQQDKSGEDDDNSDLEYLCLSKRGLSEDEKQTIIGKLQKEDKAIRLALLQLTKSLKQFVQNNIQLNDFKFFVKSLDGYRSKDKRVRLLTDRFEEIDKCKSTEEVLVILAEYYSWFDIEIIETIFEYYCNPELLGGFEFGEKLGKYKETHEKYFERRLFEFPNKISRVSHSAKRLYLITSAEPQNKRAFLSNIADLLNIKYALKLVEISPKCVLLVFSIPSAIAKEAFPLSSSQEKELMSLNVQKLSCNGYNFDADFADSLAKGTDTKATDISAVGGSLLRGVDVITQTSITIRADEEKSFEWKGYGLRLHSPKGALPPDLPQCTLRIQASLSGQFHFPEGSALTSAVYWISAPVAFSKPLTLEIQHSCDASPHYLKFVEAQCTQKELPYRFEPIKDSESNEVFTEHSSYGSISITKFSGIGIVHRSKSLLRSSYLAQVFLSSVSASYRWKVFFVVTKDLDATKTLAQRALSGLVKEKSLKIEFASDEIVITKSESTDSQWQLEPKFHPSITKAEVDGYSTHREPPKCEFMATWIGSRTEPYLPQVELHLEGAKSPWNYITINFSRPLRAVGADMAIPRTDEPELDPNLSALIEAIRAERPNWRHIGIILGGFNIHEMEVRWDHIRRELHDLFIQRLNRAPPHLSPRQLEELALALRRAGMEMEAHYLELCYHHFN